MKVFLAKKGYLSLKFVEKFRAVLPQLLDKFHEEMRYLTNFDFWGIVRRYLEFSRKVKDQIISPSTVTYGPSWGLMSKTTRSKGGKCYFGPPNTRTDDTDRRMARSFIP